MGIIVQPKIDGRGNIQDPVSVYIPDDRTKERFKDILADFKIGQDIMDASYEEFGGGSENEALDLKTYQNKLQKRFNNNIPSISDDPNQEWRANTIRPLTRNKVVSIVAHVTNSILYPTIIAQNEESEEDKDMAMIMQDAVEWACEQMKYEDIFFNAIFDLCVNPAVIIQQDYAQVKRKIKEITSKDKWEYKEIIDEIYSGFFSQIIPCDELYIGNIYESDIQKQPFLIRRKVMDYSTAERKYGDNKNFKEYVEPGLKIFYDENSGNFYQQYDDELQDRLVEELTYYNQNADLELRILNGVLMDDPDRPLQRKDKKYPFSKTYFEPFNSRFFYGMSLVAKLMPNQDTIDTMWNMTIDGTFLSIMPPIAVYGSEDIDSSVLVPGSTTAFKDPASRAEAIALGTNISAGINALQVLEKSADESSQAPQGAGLATSGQRTKFEVMTLEQNAQTTLGNIGKMIGFLVRDFGSLLVGSIIQFMPIAEVSEITGDDVRLKFPSILMPNREVSGKIMSLKIEFTTEMPQSEEEQNDLEFDLFDKSGENMSIVMVNPDAFRRMKYLTKVEPDFSGKTTKFFKKLQLYDRLVANPLANQEAVLRDFLLNPFVPGKEDKYIMSQQQNQILKEALKGGKGERLPQGEAVPTSPSAPVEAQTAEAII